MLLGKSKILNNHQEMNRKYYAVYYSAKKQGIFKHQTQIKITSKSLNLILTMI